MRAAPLGRSVCSLPGESQNRISPQRRRDTEQPHTPKPDPFGGFFDELESHLHPRWQRTILGSLLHIVKDLHDQAEIQLIAATHSPLILASAEPFFDSAQDAWFDIDLEHKNVILRSREFVNRGEVSNWLTSDAFDLKQARSLEAEKAIEQAFAVLRELTPTRRAIDEADRALRDAKLPDIDPFWVRWGYFMETHRGNQRASGKAGAKKEEKPK